MNVDYTDSQNALSHALSCLIEKCSLRRSRKWLKPRPDMQLVAGNKLHVWTGLYCCSSFVIKLF